jgi:hypothetical protein
LDLFQGVREHILIFRYIVKASWLFSRNNKAHLKKYGLKKCSGVLNCIVFDALKNGFLIAIFYGNMGKPIYYDIFSLNYKGDLIKSVVEYMEDDKNLSIGKRV